MLDFGLAKALGPAEAWLQPRRYAAFVFDPEHRGVSQAGTTEKRLRRPGR